MAPQPIEHLWAALGAVVVLFGIAIAQNGPSIPLKYCASVNTANMPAINNDYQSQGRCLINCTSLDFALAIVQSHNCWCSNLIPNKRDQKSLGHCQDPCPGYPDDYCGGAGTFGYMALDKQPQGTADAGVTNSITSSLPNDDGSATPTPTVQTVTVGGVIKTVTATPSSGSNQANLATSKDSGLSTGATIGIAVGVVGVFAVGAIFLIIYCLKRKRRQQGETLDPSSRRGSSPAMLSTPATNEVSESRLVGGASAAPVWDVSSQNSKRRSHLMPVDPRLDPFAKGIYVRDQNKSHDSIGSLQDNQDYSRRIQDPPRVLRAVNPDPDV